MYKSIVYYFFYNCFKPKYDENMHLYYTDTDSFELSINIENVYKTCS